MKTIALLLPLIAALSILQGCSRETDTTPVPDSTRASAPSAPSRPRYTTFKVDARSERIELFLHDDSGRVFNRFGNLNRWLTSRNARLRFAMNAGMFEPDFSPVGLLVQNGRELSPLNLRDGTGNFYLKPNGVFLIGTSGPRIVESSEYPSITDSVYLATQSGPLLVRRGEIHPGFNAASESRLIRNGVGVSGDTVVFVISEKPVSFHEFAMYFRDELHCADALYLDGVVSSLYSAELGRNDYRSELGPIIGVLDGPLPPSAARR